MFIFYLKEGPDPNCLQTSIISNFWWWHDTLSTTHTSGVGGETLSLFEPERHRDIP